MAATDSYADAPGVLRSPPRASDADHALGAVRPIIDRAQLNSAPKRLAKPLRNARCTNSHTTHAGKPAQPDAMPAEDGAEAADRGDAAQSRGT